MKMIMFEVRDPKRKLITAYYVFVILFPLFSVETFITTLRSLYLLNSFDLEFLLPTYKITLVMSVKNI